MAENKRVLQRKKALVMGISSKSIRSMVSSFIKQEVKMMKIIKNNPVKTWDLSEVKSDE